MIRLCGSTASVKQEYLGWNQKGDERELSRMSDKKHLVNGRFSVSAKTQDSGLWRRTPCLTSRLLDSAQVKGFTTTMSRVRQSGGQSIFIPIAYAA